MMPLPETSASANDDNAPDAPTPAELLKLDQCPSAGNIYHMDYSEAFSYISDAERDGCGGVPVLSFLLAYSSDTDKVLLLRVEGTDTLASHPEKVRILQEHIINTVEGESWDDGIDFLSKMWMSGTALRCSILGTFYTDKDGQVAFGSGVDDIRGLRSWRVVKPVNDTLRIIGSQEKADADSDEDFRVKFGRVRYAEVETRESLDQLADAGVSINIEDVVGKKTALFGMTRTGKSNTVKCLLARVIALSKERNENIGQLVFDPQGEYANDNTQDEGTSLASMDNVTVFKARTKPNTSERPLGVSLYSIDQVDLFITLINRIIGDAEGDYVAALRTARFTKAENKGDSAKKVLDSRMSSCAGMAVLYAMLYDKLDIGDTPAGWSLQIKLSDIGRITAGDIAEGLLDCDLSPDLVNGTVVTLRCGEDLVEFADVLARNWHKKADRNENEFVAALAEQRNVAATIPFYTGRKFDGGSVSGFFKLTQLAGFHNHRVQTDVREEIYELLLRGGNVIIDLSAGSTENARVMSEFIAEYILNRQTKSFVNGMEPPSVQLILEEAHNLFSSNEYSSSSRMSVWVRIAKEASKLNMGLMYATQEPSGVAHELLANTSNWFVAHLNNTVEVRHLSKFYSFSAFESSLMSQEAKGFVRMKTLSSPYIVPCQVDKFDASMTTLKSKYL